MPELPEVESARSLIETHCKGARIASLIIEEQGGGPRSGSFDDIVFDVKTGKNRDDFNSLEGSSLCDIKRQGKQLWMELGDGASLTPSCSLLCHFGMTGSFVIKGEPVPQYKSFEVKNGEGDSDKDWPPKFTKMLLIFDNGKELAFCDPRRLGRIRIRSADPREEEPISKLAPDPTMWNKSVPPSFVAALQGLRTNVKAALLDQEKLVSGVGNWVADEVLYQCGIHPATKCEDLPAFKAVELGQKLIDVCQEACTCTCSRRKFPETWLFEYRWGKKKKNTVDQDFYGRSITFETVGGRTSAIVQKVQKKTFGSSSAESAGSATSSAYFKREENEGEAGTKKRKAPATKDTGKGKGKGKKSKVKKEAN